MHEKTLAIMCKVETKLNRFEKLALTACGFESELAKADRARTKLMKYIETELDILCEKAGEP